MFDANYIIQNNSYLQLSATLCVFQPLLRDPRQTSTERFMKSAVVRYFCGTKISLPLALQVPKLDWVVQGVISACLFSHAIPGNWASIKYSKQQ